MSSFRSPGFRDGIGSAAEAKRQLCSKGSGNGERKPLLRRRGQKRNSRQSETRADRAQPHHHYAEEGPRVMRARDLS